MKQFFTLSAAVLCSIGAYAQNSQKPVNPLMPKSAKTVKPSTTPEKTTGADTRMIATVNATYGASSFEVEDSSVVSYTGNNGWDYATEGWKFDSGIQYTVNPVWIADGKIYQTIVNNRIATILFKQLQGSVWEDQYKSTYTYTNGLIASETTEYNMGSGLTPSSRNTNTYNGDMLITENLHESWNSGAWEKSMRTLNHYNAAKMVDTSIDQSWIAMTSQWLDQNRSISIYSNGQLAQMLRQMNNGSGWEDAYHTLYTYDANGRVSVEINEQWDNSTSTWMKTYRSEYAYNTAGDMIEEKGSHWNNTAWEYDGKSVYTYNQYHRLLTEESQTWDNTASQWFYDSGNDYKTTNYYEAYTNDVKTVASNRAELKVFPVPAKEQITISASFQQMQSISVVIMDMSGRVIKQMTDHAGTQYRQSISVADLAAGNYMINIVGTTEVASKMISVTR